MVILVVVESPGKISKISSLLGKNYKIVASEGIFRDLAEKGMSLDFQNHFQPIYVITKPAVVKKLKIEMRGAEILYIASDLDREGEGIAQSIYDVLKPKKYKRLVFNSITRDALEKAIAHAGKINVDLVNAQKSRRVLDRLYGYLVSGVLQKKIGKGLSAGRVQSPTLELIVEQERKIEEFLEENQQSSFFGVSGVLSKWKVSLFCCRKSFPDEQTEKYLGDAATIPFPEKNVLKFLKDVKKSQLRVHFLSEKDSIRSPSPPFTTSTLQQEASRRLKMPIDMTMRVAQKLYEAGFITYMRTDSNHISPEGQRDIKRVIISKFGKDYYRKTVYKNKVANAQEGHECCRPTHSELETLEGEIADDSQIKLYQLIWNRTIASQMSPAKLRIITMQISISRILRSGTPYYFQSQMEHVIFPGFLKVYRDLEEDQTSDYTEVLPEIGDLLQLIRITAKQEYLTVPPRYTEASLVKKLEELGIGRPSTFVKIIKNIINREYLIITDIPGIEKESVEYIVKGGESEIERSVRTIYLGAEKSKLKPTSLGEKVNAYLISHFAEMMEYQFTAMMENELDEIANGKKIWYQVVQIFYDRLKPLVDKAQLEKGLAEEKKKILGKANGFHIYQTETKYGPVVVKEKNDKRIYAKIYPPLSPDNLTLEEALTLFQYPQNLGEYRGEDILLKKGKYGFYLQYGEDQVHVEEPVTPKEAISLIKQNLKKYLGKWTIQKGKQKIEVHAIQGKYGPYLRVKKGSTSKNIKIPEGQQADLTEETVEKLISGYRKQIATRGKKSSKGRETVKRTKKKVEKSGSKRQTKL